MQVSVVVPIFNEEENIPELYKRLRATIPKIAKKYEIIFVNDGSVDESLNLLKRLRNKDYKIKIISFSRNFGHMAAVDAGLSLTSGEWVVIMDADLQDPPELIPEMIIKAKKGFDVVYGVKRNRKEGVFRRVLFSSFYKTLNGIASYKMPMDAGTFSVVNRRVVKVLVNLPEKNKYLSGLRSWVGFSQTGFVYDRRKRFSGREASLTRLFKLAFDGIFSFSYIPLRLASILGFACAFLAFLSIIGVFILRIFFGFGIIGWASTTSIILLVGGIQLITLGIIGEYLARIYDEVKNRPEYIIKEKFGFKD